MIIREEYHMALTRGDIMKYRMPVSIEKYIFDKIHVDSATLCIVMRHIREQYIQYK